MNGLKRCVRLVEAHPGHSHTLYLIVFRCAQGNDKPEDLVEHSDRSLVPRGNTPLLDVGYDFAIPDEYKWTYAGNLGQDRSNEYRELLMRGATEDMCTTFHLEFTYEGGIYAWADPQLYEEFTGPPMQVGDFWKIHLGRRITLDEGDLDGSLFVENLLEDAVLFRARWETKEETPGIWVTRLTAHTPADPNYDSSDEAQRTRAAEIAQAKKAFSDQQEDPIQNSYDTTDDVQEDEGNESDGSTGSSEAKEVSGDEKEMDANDSDDAMEMDL